jgi:hypothetical protein
MLTPLIADALDPMLAAGHWRGSSTAPSQG